MVFLCILNDLPTSACYNDQFESRYKQDAGEKKNHCYAKQSRPFDMITCGKQDKPNQCGHK